MSSTFDKMPRFLLRITKALVLGIALLVLPRLALAQDAAGFDAVANFNSANNPAASSTFTYGWGLSPAAFTPLPHDVLNCLGTPMDCRDTGGEPYDSIIWWNGTSGNILFAPPLQSFVPPTMLRMDPQYRGAIVRFTAPASAIYNISGTYQGLDQNQRPANAQVYVNGALAFQTTISSFGQVSPFGLTNIPVAEGQTIDFIVTSASSYGSLSTGLAAKISPVVSGYLNPKYLIMGVTYAPPGGNSSSYVSYQNSTLVGNQSVNSSSFSDDFMESVEGSANFSIPGVLSGEIKATASQEWTQKSTTQNSVTISKTNAVTFKTPGVPNVYSPVDHDYDIIWLWLNPAVLFSVYSPDSMAWLGYGYDLADPLQEIDIWPVYVGYLNGDFGSLDAQDADALSRSWVKTQTFAPGDGPGITSADYPNILSADPFAYNPYDANSGCPSSCYTLALAPGNPPTTTDGRFTLSESNNTTPQTLIYKQAYPGSTTGEQESYQLTNQTSTVATQTADNIYKVGYGLEETSSGGLFGTSLNTDLKQNWTMTWENISQTSVTNTSTQTDTAQITGPPCPAATAPCNPEYTEPHEFALYVDNLYGTFMFWPNPYFSIWKVAPTTRTVAAGNAISYTISTQANAGYDGTSINISVTGLPADASFSQGTVKPGDSLVLTVTTKSATPAGSFPLTISATDGSLSYLAYATLVVLPSTRTSLVSSLNPSHLGKSVTLTATVASAGANMPTGKITFSDGSLVLGASVLNSSGVATYTTSSLKVGQHSLTAVYGGDTNNTGSTSAKFDLIVDRARPTITWANPATITFGAKLSASQLDARASASARIVDGTYTYKPEAGEMLKAGTHLLTVKFEPADTSNYEAATSSVDLMVNKAAQKINFEKIVNQTYTPDLVISLNATGGASENPVMFSLLNGESRASIMGNKLTIKAAGPFEVAANQRGDANYHPAAFVTQKFVVSAAGQTIKFNPLSTATKGSTITLEATASSGLPVSFAVSGPATLNGKSLEFTGTGTVTVTASQQGNLDYASAPAARKEIAVALE